MKKCDSCKDMEWDLDLLRHGIVLLFGALIMFFFMQHIGLPPKINCDECQNCIVVEDNTGWEYTSINCKCEAEIQPDCNSDYAKLGRGLHAVLFGILALGTGICSIGTFILFWMFIQKVRP